MEVNDEDDAPPSSPESVTAFQCQYCGEIFMHERRLVAHKRQAHAEAHKIDCEQREFGLLIGDPKLFVSSSEDEDDDESEEEDMEYFEVSEDVIAPLPEPEIVQTEVQVDPEAPPSPPAAEPEPPQLDLSHLTDQERRNLDTIIRYRNKWNIPKEDNKPLAISFSEDGEILGVYSSSSTLVLSPPSSWSGSTCEDLSDDQSTATPSTQLDSKKARIDKFCQLVRSCLHINVEPLADSVGCYKIYYHMHEEEGVMQQVAAAGGDCENNVEKQVHCGSLVNESHESSENEIQGSTSAEHSVFNKTDQTEEVPVGNSEITKDPRAAPTIDDDSASGSILLPSEEEYQALSQIEKQLEMLFETGSVNGDCDKEPNKAQSSEETPQTCDCQVPVAEREEIVQPSFKPRFRKRTSPKKRQVLRAAFAKTLKGRKIPGKKLRVSRELAKLVKAAGQYVQVPERLRSQRPTSPPTEPELPQLEPEAPFSFEDQPASLLSNLTTLKVTLRKPSLDGPWQVVRPDSSPLSTDVSDTPPAAAIDNDIDCSMPVLQPESQQLDSYTSSPSHASENPFRPSSPPPTKRRRIQVPNTCTSLSKNPLKESTNTAAANADFNCRICTHSKVSFKSAQKLADHESNVHGCSIVVDDRGNDVFTFQVPAIHKCPECETPFRYEFVAKRHALKCKQLKKSTKS